YETQERFRMALAFQSDLDDLVLSEDLLQVFETNDMSLSKKSTISVKQKGAEWLISDTDKKQTYIVRKKVGWLNVHETNMYLFGVNLLGIQIDARRSDYAWNLDWLSRTVATETGWTAEMAIPLVAFGADLYENEWRIGVRRGDEINDETVTLAPSFTITSRENRLPEYRHSISDASSLSPLTFENLKPAYSE
ncbi:MAG: hypothetical protein O7E52_05340, partial [Candidatus Poribacteria bacterium]|nr:hypothetical protein [Candidatus Poribacteria bacterium]